MATQLICSTSKEPVTNMIGTTSFSCPNCGKTKIVRSPHMRAIAAPYKCHECGFIGPLQ